MKYFSIALALAAFQAYTCNAAANASDTGSTITCAACPTTTTSGQFVTRTNAPTSSCSAPALTVLYNTASASTSGTSTKPTPSPFTGAAGKKVGSMSGALAMGVAAFYML